MMSIPACPPSWPSSTRAEFVVHGSASKATKSRGLASEGLVQGGSSNPVRGHGDVSAAADALSALHSRTFSPARETNVRLWIVHRRAFRPQRLSVLRTQWAAACEVDARVSAKGAGPPFPALGRLPLDPLASFSSSPPPPSTPVARLGEKAGVQGWDCTVAPSSPQRWPLDVTAAAPARPSDGGEAFLGPAGEASFFFCFALYSLCLSGPS